MKSVQNSLMCIQQCLFRRILNSNKCLNILSYRSLAKEKSKATQDIPVYTRKDHEFKVVKHAVRKKLVELFDLKPFSVNELLKQHTILSKTSAYRLGDNFKICTDNGIKPEVLLKNISILGAQGIEEKIEELKQLNYDINALTPLLRASLNHLREFVGEECTTQRSRIKFLSNTFRISEEVVFDYLGTRSFLLTMDMDKMESNIKLLNSFRVTNDDILKDLWVLRYSEKIIKERLIIAKKNKLEKGKTWMVRAQCKIFDRYLKRRSDNKLILGNNSLAEYLSERLECTVDEAKVMILKLPALQNKNLIRIKEMIDFLYSYGFNSNHIKRIPKILLHSMETTKMRLKELESKKMKLDSLHILTKSKKQYAQYYDTKTKKKKLKRACT